MQKLCRRCGRNFSQIYVIRQRKDVCFEHLLCENINLNSRWIIDCAALNKNTEIFSRNKYEFNTKLQCEQTSKPIVDNSVNS